MVARKTPTTIFAQLYPVEVTNKMKLTRDMLLEFKKEGLTLAEIARRLGRARGSVSRTASKMKISFRRPHGSHSLGHPFRRGNQRQPDPERLRLIAELDKLDRQDTQDTQKQRGGLERPQRQPHKLE